MFLNVLLHRTQIASLLLLAASFMGDVSPAAVAAVDKDGVDIEDDASTLKHAVESAVSG